MKKWILLFIVMTSLLAGCQESREEISESSSSESISSVSSESSSNEINDVAEYYSDLNKFVGEWECIDPDFPGGLVSICEVPEENGLEITYEGEEATATILSEVDSENKLWRFHNEEIEMNYTIIEEDPEVITLYRSTTAEGVAGVSKPMEYQKIM